MIIRLLAAIGCLQVVTALPLGALPLGALPLGAAGPRANQERLDAVCVSCLILHVPAESATMRALPDQRLTGLTIVVSVTDPSAAAALDQLGEAGAVGGLLLRVGDLLPAADVLRRGKVLVLRGVSDDEASVFAVRTVATAAREVRPDMRILIEGERTPEALKAYADGIVVQGPDAGIATTDALVALAHTAAASSNPLLISVASIGWNAVGALAALRPLSTEVVAAPLLNADEIVARHQAQRARQERLVRRTIATGHTSLLFEVPGFVAPVTVTADTVIYRAPGLTEMEQLDIRVNGAPVAGGDAASAPKLPLIEPERIATPPLVIALGDAYRYSLVGRDVIDGAPVYVIGFEPSANRGLAHGRAWIDARAFALRRLETTQTGLRGAIVSSEQHDRFAVFHVKSEEVWLPVRTNVYQMYEGAGHRTPIHRTIATPDYVINPDDFDARLQAAHASSHLMLRETTEGFRYLLRDACAPDNAGRELAPRAGERIRTAVFGILLDPNITVPLPFAGFSYVDLNVLNTGTQLNVFFGGSYGQLSWSVPSLSGTRWQAHGRAFAIAARYNDRAFVDGIERYAENIRQRPAHASAGLLRPVGKRLRARFDYELDYTAFDRSDTTAATFIVPADALVHGFVGTIEAESGPWSVRAWWNPAVRQRWRQWGTEAPDAPAVRDAFQDARTFQRYGTAVARTLLLRGVTAARVEAAWMDGRDLDRFSRYTFGAFENRLHGYPTASIRYDRGAVLRSVTSWVARGWRVEAFGDMAVARDPGFGPRFRGYPGIGAAVELAGPLHTLWSVEWGYGFRARRGDGGVGTQAVRVTGVRVF